MFQTWLEALELFSAGVGKWSCNHLAENSDKLYILLHFLTGKSPVCRGNLPSMGHCPLSIREDSGSAFWM